jgi:formylglycine-generating enzyme required for sulfatase activity
MRPEHWAEIRAAFEAAAELPAEQRQAFLAARVGTDNELRREVDELLAAVDDSDGFLEPPPLGGFRVGTRIGRYEIVRALGSGGMATVYEAIQEQPHRRVALKVMRAGLGTTKALRRFQYESELLARLRHPGIALVHESGVLSDGVIETPWFAMELLDEALPITSFAERRQLSIDARLELFSQVCAAVHHGHQRGVIHRDLKPGNLLVEKGGQAKVIDFGIARTIDDELAESLALTMQGDIVGTLQYMSPEQVAGRIDELDLRTDVYSLGVVLYELLTGALPHDLRGKPLPETSRIICESEPSRPSSRAPLLPRELDWIVLKAMAKEPERRYDTVDMLARDIGRFRRHEALTAGPPSAVYYLRKFVRRHRLAMTAAALLLATLIAGVVTTLVQKRRADRAAELAEAKVDEFDMLANVEHLRLARAEFEAMRTTATRDVAGMLHWLESRAATLRAANPRLRATIAQLRDRALPEPAAELEAWRRRHPRSADVDRLQQRLAALRRAQAVSDGVAAPAEVPLDAATTAVDTATLTYLAWVRVGPNRERFGEEQLGLAMAKLAVARAGDDERAEARKTLAWALLANGHDDESLDATRAYAEVCDDLEPLVELRRAIGACRDGGRRQQIDAAGHDLDRLRAELATAREWRFAKESDRFLHDTLADLTAQLDAFEAGPVCEVVRSLIWARYELMALQRHRSRWDEARNAVRRADGVVASTLYAAQPLELLPQPGLVPIGMNPKTQLWEFHHIRSAALPHGLPRHRPDGTIETTDETGMIFVLVPGGRFVMGAQTRDPAQPGYFANAEVDESPLREVVLAPFFLARHEMTQGQWQRLAAGENPSWLTLGSPTFNDRVPRVTLRHPVENISWVQCDAMLGRLQLVLPTEAQWEYACRAGTDSPWFTGTDKPGLARFANLADATSGRYRGGRHEPDIDDGWFAPAPCGSFEPNPFGLHEMLGNVAEWCRDRKHSYVVPARERDGLRDEPTEVVDKRVLRGGHFASAAQNCRSAARNATDPGHHSQYIGVRAAAVVRARAFDPANETQALLTTDFHRRVARAVPLQLIVQLGGIDEEVRYVDPTLMPITVGARVTASAPDGVVAAHGGTRWGYALYVVDREPHFAVRNDRQLYVVRGPRLTLGQPVHLVGVLDADEQLHLFVDGDEKASAPGALLTDRPLDGLTLGRDKKSGVGDYTGEMRWHGTIESLRLYQGVLPPDQLRAWACGEHR